MTAELSKGVVDIQLVVEDLEASLEFSRDSLGFEVEEVVNLVPGVVQHRLRAGQALVKLIYREPERAAGMIEETGYRGLTIQLDNFDDTVASLRKSGIEFALDVRESLAHPGSGNRICIVRDAEGNHVELESKTSDT